MPFQYDRAQGPEYGPKREAHGTRDIQDFLISFFGVPGIRDGGIYNPRKVAGTTAWSVHSEGRAGDIMLNAFREMEKEAGDAIATFLTANWEALGIQYITWDGAHWGGSTGNLTWRPRSGNPHTDHIHWEQTRAASRAVYTTDYLNTLVLGDDIMTNEEIQQAIEDIRDAVAPTSFRRADGRPHDVAFAALQANGSIQGNVLPALANMENIVKTAVDRAFAGLELDTNVDVAALAATTSAQVINDIRGVWSE